MDGRANQLYFEEGQDCLPTSPAGSVSEWWLPNAGPDLDEQRWAAPRSFAQEDLARPRDKPAEQVPVGLQVQPRVMVESSRQPGCSDPHDGRGGGASRGSRLHRRIGDHRRSSPP